MADRSSEFELRLQRRLREASQVVAAIVGIIAALVFLSWAIRSTTLASSLPGLSEMKANTALLFLLSASAVWLVGRGAPDPRVRLAARACAAVVLSISALTASQYLGGWNLGIDELLFRDTQQREAAVAPGRMSPLTTIGFVLLGGAVFLLDFRSRVWPSQSLILALMVGSLLAVVGYLYSVESLYRVGPYAPMPALTALKFFLLGCAFLMARPEQGLMSVLVSSGPGGLLLRRLLPLGTLLPVVIGFVRLQGERAGLYDTTFGLALFTMTNITLILLLALWGAVSLNRLDATRQTVARELSQSEERFRQAVESMPNGIVMINRSGQMVLVNHQTERLFGYERDELLGQKVELLVPERFRGNHPAFREEFCSDPSVRAMGQGRELFGCRKDGSEFPVEIGLTPIETAEGLLVLSAIVDITERRRAEEQFRLAVESAPNGMVMIDRQGLIVLVNAQTEKLFGYAREDLLGQPVELLVPDRFRGQHPSYREGFFAAPAVRSMGVGRDLFGRRKDGSEFPVEIGLNPLHTSQGWFVLSAVVDITERKLAENAIQQLNEELEQRVVERTEELRAANKELEAFSYSVSHDLRAPLRAIDGFSRILLQEHSQQLPEEAQSFLEDVRSNTQRMGELVDDLLSLSQLGRQPLQVATVDMRSLVDQCLKELEPERSGREVEIRVEPLPAGQGDPRLLKQVWLNLISNALKYTSAKPRATITIGASTSGEERETTYSIRDNGVGFDMRFAHKLFGVFQRLHRAEEYEGTGVGLAIVERIVKRHGGRVWAEAEPGRGAAFFFTLSGKGDYHD